MKIIYTILLQACILVACGTLNAQSPTYQAPDNISLTTAEECRAHNDDFIKATDYLLATSLDVSDRKYVNGLAMLWMTNTSDVSLNINTDIIKPIMTGGDLLILYMAGWSRYVLSTHDTSTLNGNIAGYRTVVAYCADPKHKVPNSKEIERLIKLNKEGKLEAEVAAMLKEHK